MPRLNSYIDNPSAPTVCEQRWVDGIQCPDPPSFLVVTKHATGFAVMCKEHKDDFDLSMRLLECNDYIIEPYSLERAVELQQKVREAYEVTRP